MTFPIVSPATAGLPPQDHPLMAKAKELEVAFLSEMLGQAGFGKAQEGFGGGIGEDQFSSFLRDAQAKRMVDRGGIGLAEQIFKSLVKGQNNGH